MSEKQQQQQHEYQFTTEEKWRAVRREIAIRERVYPQRVAARKMSEEDARQQLAIMRAIANDYGGGL
jgi:hypothetical protein